MTNLKLIKGKQLIKPTSCDNSDTFYFIHSDEILNIALETGIDPSLHCTIRGECVSISAHC